MNTSTRPRPNRRSNSGLRKQRRLRLELLERRELLAATIFNEIEPNNSLSVAQPLGEAGEISLQGQSSVSYDRRNNKRSQDIDYFRFSLSETQNVNFTLDAPFTGASRSLFGVRTTIIGEGNQQPTASFVTDSDEQASELDVESLAAGSYVIEVTLENQTNSSANFSSTFGYTLGIVGANGNSGGDPNNSISGVVFNDANGNELHDADELRLENVMIYLDANENGTFDSSSETSVQTEADGSFAFNSLADGTYIVREVVPNRHVQTVPPNGSYSLTVADGQTVTGRDFGSRVPPGSIDPDDYFGQPSVLASGISGAQSLATGDFDGDGKNEIVVGGSDLYLIDSDGAVSLISTGGSVAYEIVAGDIDQDGDLDLAVAFGSAVYWYKNDGKAVFTEHRLGDGQTAHGIAVGDIDGDGDMDIAQAAGDKKFPKLFWYENTGTGNLTNFSSRSVIQDLTEGSDPWDVEIADLNGDNRNEVILAMEKPDSGISQISSFTYQGPHSYARRNIGSANVPTRIEVADLQGNGSLDIVSSAVFPNASAHPIYRWKNNGSGIFASTFASTSKEVAYDVAIGDIDSDGDIDLAFGERPGFGGLPGKIRWLENYHGDFIEHTLPGTYLNIMGLAISDVTGDHKPDIIATLSTDGKVIVFENQPGTAASTPSLAIRADNADRDEGNSGVLTPYTFTVTRSGPTTEETRVDFVVSGSGTNPANGSDFENGGFAMGTVTFAASEAMKTITVNVAGDAVPEMDEAFSVRLRQATGGATITTESATGTIRNDDNATAAPEVSVTGNAVNIVDGDTTPALNDHTNFGSVTRGGTPIDRIFTVKNDGNSALLSSGLVVPTGFKIVENLSASIAAGASDTFTVRLKTEAVGVQSGQVSFISNDTNESPFNFSITGVVNDDNTSSSQATITIGNVTAIPGSTNVKVDLMISGGEDITAVSMPILIGSGPAPQGNEAIELVGLDLTGSIWENRNANGALSDDSGPGGGVVNIAISAGNVTAVANGKLATLLLNVPNTRELGGAVITASNLGSAELVAENAVDDQRIALTIIDGRINVSNVSSTQILGRHLYYDGSAYDESPGIDSENTDGNAIATDIEPLLTGMTATSRNYSNYAKGINGIILDIENPINGAAITSSDFEFRTGNSNNVSGFSSVPVSNINVRAFTGGGSNGSTRVVIHLTDSTVENGWLEVRALASSPNLGLANDDVFYFGNQAGETKLDTGSTAVNAIDVSRIANNPTGFSPAGLNNPYDINRDNSVNAIDVSLVANRPTGFSSLMLITPSASQASGESLFSAQLTEKMRHDVNSDSINLAVDAPGAINLLNARSAEGEQHYVGSSSRVSNSHVLATPAAKALVQHGSEASEQSTEMSYQLAPKIKANLRNSQWEVSIEEQKSFESVVPNTDADKADSAEQTSFAIDELLIAEHPSDDWLTDLARSITNR